MRYGYARVSTRKQLAGNSMEDQIRLLTQQRCDEIITEQYTGATTNRPKFEKLIQELKTGDMLIVTKLDRFARNVTEGIEIIRYLFSQRVKVYVLNVGLLENTAMGNFFLTTLLAVAELERAMIFERTMAGKEIARTKDGYHEGRPRIDANKLHLALNLKKNHTYREVENLTGISKSSLIRYKKVVFD
jgi:DNA invertase Pin-like site-specific DNA recombinase